MLKCRRFNPNWEQDALTTPKRRRVCRLATDAEIRRAANGKMGRS
jgi:hypothetical protein